MFSENLRNLRKKRGLTQKQAAEIFGVSQSTYALYENGKREPSFELLMQMADYFETPCDMLLGHAIKSAQKVTYSHVIAALSGVMGTGLFSLETISSDDTSITAIIPTDKTIADFLARWRSIMLHMEDTSFDENLDLYFAWMEKQVRDYDYPIKDKE